MLELGEALLTSPWIYVCVLVVSALDGLFPFLPSDSVILAASVAAVGGRPSAVLVAVAAAVGVALGDEAGYLLGRSAGGARARMPARVARVYDWAARTLHRNGVLLIATARYVPFGRVATVLAAGASGYPKVRFSVISAGSALVWAGSLVAIGYGAGRAAPENPLLGLVVAVLGVVLAGVLVRVVTRRVQRSAATPERSTNRCSLRHSGEN